MHGGHSAAVTGAENDRARTVAEQSSGAAVERVRVPREHVRADDERVARHARFDRRARYGETCNEAAARGAEVERTSGGCADGSSELRGDVWQAALLADGCEDHQIDFSGIERCILESGARALDCEVEQGHSRRRAASRPDPGTTLYPCLVDRDRFCDTRIGDDLVGERASEPHHIRPRRHAAGHELLEQRIRQ